jgi:hypothetical protein
MLPSARKSVCQLHKFFSCFYPSGRITPAKPGNLSGDKLIETRQYKENSGRVAVESGLRRG